jgi:6-phosphogluconolactonase
VTTADPGSNFRSAHECLFEPLGIEPSRIHRIRGEIAPELAAAEAEAELRRFAPPNATGQPVLDLVLLGMGEDGHVASLFPGESESERRSPRVYRPVVAPKPPPRRITLGYGVLAAAREVWVLVSGAGKEAALAESLSAEGQTPLAHVLRSRKRTRVFSDSPSRESA